MAARCRCAGAAGAEQPTLSRRVENAGEEAIRRPATEEPAAKFAEDAMAEAGVDEVQSEETLPVDPRPDGLRGLPVAQALPELHERDEREPPGRVGRLAEARVEVGEVGVGEHGAEPIPQQQVGVASGERGPGDSGRVVRHRRKVVLGRSGIAGLQAGTRRNAHSRQRLPTSPTGSGRLTVRDRRVQGWPQGKHRASEGRSHRCRWRGRGREGLAKQCSSTAPRCRGARSGPRRHARLHFGSRNFPSHTPFVRRGRTGCEANVLLRTGAAWGAGADGRGLGDP
jgi:hypothetical protein